MKSRARLAVHRWVTVVLVALALPLLLAALRVTFTAGDTLEDIAVRAYGDRRAVALLRAANGIASGAEPEPGLVLVVPSSIVHTVAAGETLESLSVRFFEGEGGAELIADANGLARGARLAPGTALTIPPELKVQTRGASAEDLAATLLQDPQQGARIRRFNGLADGAPLPAVVFVPLLGLTATDPARTTSASSDDAQATVDAAAPPRERNTPDAPPPRPLSAALTQAQASLVGFAHATHMALQVGGVPMSCLTCHLRVGDDGVVHQAPQAATCLLCHAHSDVLPAALPRGVSRRLALPMNHAQHLALEQAKLTCAQCHGYGSDAALGIKSRGHAACVSCHKSGAAKPDLLDDVSGASCTGCHVQVEEPDLRAERTRSLQAHLPPIPERGADVVFTHLTHASLSAGGVPGGEPPVACTVCHADVPTARTRDEVARVKMASCIACHARAQTLALAPPRDCSGCHTVQRRGLMPRGPALADKPLGHTAMFRRSHAAAFAASPATCASCHAGTSATDGTRCETCHATARPHDHTAGFRSRIHGLRAEVEPARCTACHRAETCEACHREPPPSHTPRSQFVDAGGHGTRARAALSACLTCHRFELTCSRCHTAERR